MADALLNGLAVLEARLTRPRWGNWVAELAVDSTTAAQLPSGSVGTLQFSGLSFIGTMIRVDTYLQTVSLRMIGGANKMGKICTPRFFRGAPVSTVIQGLLQDAGATLSPACSSAALAVNLPFWVILAHPIGNALSNLAGAISTDSVWRIQPDGSVFIGPDAFLPSLISDYQLVKYSALENVQELASELPLINPGESFNGKLVSTVEHLFTENSSRVKLLFE
jgi:hypothetical protein